MSSSQAKPELAGVKQRKRKKDIKAKYEPESFAETVISELQAVHEQGPEAVAKTLDSVGEKLDYKQYGDLLFDILFTGGVLDAGGGYVDGDETDLSPFCVFACEDNYEQIKKTTEVFGLLLRRYRYMQKSLEECMIKVLRVLNRFDEVQVKKLGVSFAIIFANQVAPMAVLSTLFMDHLVKEGLSLQFITIIFRAFLTEHSLDDLSVRLRKNGLEDQLLEFFPPNKRTSEFFARHFAAEGLDDVVKYHGKKLTAKMREKVRDAIVEMIKGESAQAEIIVYLKQQATAGELTESDLAIIAWDAMMAAVEWSRKTDQCEEQAIKQVKEWGKILNIVTTTAKAELALIVHVQVFCYEDPRFTKIFSKLVTLLYKLDVLSDSAILYWNNKGHSPKGKAGFLKQMEPLVKFLQEEDEEESEGESK